MTIIYKVAAAAILATAAATSAWAAAEDYRFELIAPPGKSGSDAVVKVRLIHLRTTSPFPMPSSSRPGSTWARKECRR
jgi:hypothetical protein